MKAVGIDFGRTSVCVGVFHDGEVNILPNEAAVKDKVIRAISGYRGGIPVQNIKRWPVEFGNGSEKPTSSVNLKNKDENFPPEKAILTIFEKIKQVVSVSDAVISVPANLDAEQRQAIRNGAVLAGFNVLELIDDTEAVVVAYGLEKHLKRNALIFNLGSCDLNISIISKEEHKLAVKAAVAMCIGGKAFNRQLVLDMTEEIMRKRNSRPYILGSQLGLGFAVFLAKQSVSSIETIIGIEELIESEGFSRAKFEELCEDLFANISQLLVKALNAANMKKKQIPRIILVGGPTRIQKVQEILKTFFKGKSFDTSVDPEEAVARGAALLAASLSGQAKGQSVVRVNVKSFDACNNLCGAGADSVDQQAASFSGQAQVQSVVAVNGKNFDASCYPEEGVTYGTDLQAAYSSGYPQVLNVVNDKSCDAYIDPESASPVNGKGFDSSTDPEEVVANIVAQQAASFSSKTKVQCVVPVNDKSCDTSINPESASPVNGKGFDSSTHPEEVVANSVAQQAASLNGPAQVHSVVPVKDKSCDKSINPESASPVNGKAFDSSTDPEEALANGVVQQADVDPFNDAKLVEGNQSKITEIAKLVIKACKENDVKALDYLFLTDLTILPAVEDKTGHNAFYYAIRADNIQLLETLIAKWSQNYFCANLKELDEFLSCAYEKLKLMNISLSEEMEIFVLSKLISLRFFSNTSKAEQQSKNDLIYNIKERVELVLQNISLLTAEYSKDKVVDEKFLFLAKFIAQNIHILKRQLKSTYDCLPWEEIEFCLIGFVSARIKQQEINFFYNATLTKFKLLNYLELFAKKLQTKIQLIKATDIGRNAELPKLRREVVMLKVLNDTPEFENLFRDYQQIKDIHSLEKMSSYIKLALSADPKEREGQLIITRVLQVIGEYLKNTLESPNLSSTTSELLLLTLPSNTRQVIIDLRNSLSHVFALSKRLEFEENSDAKFYLNVQKDTKKIDIVITDILQRNKLKVIKEMLKKVINANSLDELKDISNILSYLKSPNKNAEEFVHVTGDSFAELIKQFSDNLTDKTCYEKSLFGKIENIMNTTKDKSKTIKTDYMQTFTLLKGLAATLNDDSMDRNDIEAVKSFARQALNTIPTEFDAQKLKEIAELSRKIFQSAKSKWKELENLDELKRLTCRIFHIAEFETGDLKWIEQLREKLHTKHSFIPTYKQKRACSINEQTFRKQLTSKLTELSALLTNNNFDDDVTIKRLPLYKTDKKLQAVVEMLVLDIMSILGGLTAKHLENNLLFLDENTPLLTGKSLRNHLAHDNTIVDEFLTDPAIAVVLNAKKLTTENVLGSKRKVGKWIRNDPLQLKAKYERDLSTIRNLENMFAALESGNLVDLKKALSNGADLKAKSFHAQNALHFAVRGDNVELLRYVLEHNFDVNEQDVHGQSPLHIAAEHGKALAVEFLVKEAAASVDVVDNSGRTPLHKAAANGHQRTVEILFKHNADISITDIEEYTPAHFAVKHNQIEVAKFLLLKAAKVNSNEALGGFTPLHTAAEKGHLELLNFLLEHEADVRAKNENGGIPLHLAALNGHLKLVKSLIANGTDVNTCTMQGVTALHCAIKNGHTAVTKMLLEHGADIEVLDLTCNKTPLHYAAEIGLDEIVQALLHRKCNASVAMFGGLTALHLATLNGHISTVAQLLVNDVNIHSKDDKKATALHYASEWGHKKIVELLLAKGAVVNDKRDKNITPLHLAALAGHLKICDVLLRNKADIKAKDLKCGTPLHAAALGGHRDVIKLLLKNKAVMHAKTTEGMTPLHFAALGGHEAAVTLFIEHKADVNATAEHSLTPLHAAVVNGHKDAVHVLLKNHAKVDAKGMDDATPLQVAAEAGLKDIVELLLTYGANANVKHCYRKLTPLISAAMQNHREVVEMLLANGADVNAENCEPLGVAVLAGHTDIVNVLIKNKARINIKDPEGGTLLHVAAQQGHKEIVEALLAKGANVDAKTLSGLTPLHLAVKAGHDDVVECLLANRASVHVATVQGLPLHVAAVHGYVDIVEALLRNGTKATTKDCDNRTSLELAVSYGHLQVVKILLQHTKVDLDAKGNDGYTILHIAAQQKNINMVKFLIDEGCNIHARNRAGSKPIHIAAREGFLDAIKLFLSKGLSVHEFGTANQTLMHYAAMEGHLEVVQYLMAHGADVNAKDTTDLTPMHIAALFGHTDLIKLLLENGANIDAIFQFKRPIDMTNNRNVVRFLEISAQLFEAVKEGSCAPVERCIKAGACLNATNRTGMTPLFYAAWKGFQQVVELLLQQKAKPNICDHMKLSPLHYASNAKHFETVKLLLCHGAVYNAVSLKGKTPFDLTTSHDIKNLLQLTNDAFIKAKAGNSQLIEDLNSIKDPVILKAVLNAQDTERKTLVAIAITNNFPKLTALKNVAQADVSKRINEALVLFSRGDYTKALKMFTSLYEKRKALLGPDNPFTLEIQAYMAKMLSKQGFLKQALTMLEEIHEKQQTTLGACHVDTLSTKNTVALVLHEQGDNEKALKMYREILKDQKQTLGANHADILCTQLHMALVLDKLEQFEEAFQLNRLVYEAHKQKLGPHDPATLSAQNNMAMVLGNQGKYAAALKIYQTVYEKKKNILGENHPDTLRTLHNIADVLYKQKRNFAALKTFEQVLHARLKTMPNKNHPEILGTQYSIANTLLAQGKLISALKAYKQCADQMKAVYGLNDPKVLEIQMIIEMISSQLHFVGSDAAKILQAQRPSVIVAASKGDSKTVKHLLINGANVNEKDNEGRTPLHFAINNGHIDVVNVLLENGAAVAQATNKGNTSLHTACVKGNKVIVETLLKHINTDQLYEFVNANTFSSGSTALHIAAKRDSFEIVKFLLKNGARYDAKDNDGKTSFSLSKSQEIKNLLKSIENQFKEFKDGSVEAIGKLRALKPEEFLATTNARNSEGKTLLQVALANGQKHLASKLLKVIKNQRNQ